VPSGRKDLQAISISKGMISLNSQYLPSHLGLGFWIVDPYKVIDHLHLCLVVTVKFIVKKSNVSV
jgi:hypothetical protein